MARIALIGASGNVGTRILNELVSRNHQVTAIVRDPSKVPAQAGVTAMRGDVADPAGLADPALTRGRAGQRRFPHDDSMPELIVVVDWWRAISMRQLSIYLLFSRFAPR